MSLSFAIDSEWKARKSIIVTEFHDDLILNFDKNLILDLFLIDFK